MLLRHGVLQRGVFSCTLFLTFINDLIEKLNRIKAALDTYDLITWCIDEHATVAAQRLHRVADILTSWEEKKIWTVSIKTELK